MNIVFLNNCQLLKSLGASFSSFWAHAIRPYRLRNC